MSENNETTIAVKKTAGPMGELGKGTPGSRLKSAWRKAGRPHGSLKKAARAMPDDADAVAWLKAKAA